MKRSKKRILLAWGCLSLVSGLAGPSWSRPPAELHFPPLKFSPPKVERKVLGCGATVFLLPDHELPLVNVSAVIRAGSMFEPAGQTGLAGLVGTLLRGGGTKQRSRERIDEELEFAGASVETGMDVESGNASMSCLSKDLKKTLQTFVEVLREPAFDAGKLEIEKSKLIESIRRRNDEPFQIARREVRKSIYGLTHPLSRTPEIPSIKKISRKDLASFYANFFRPENFMVTVTGDFDAAEMLRMLDEVFAGWPEGRTAWPAVEVVSQARHSTVSGRKVIYAEKDLNQCSVILGRLGVKRHNPDRFALEVMNEILGGSSFSSRLTKEVRAKMGLAYWVGSNFSEPYDLGTIAAGCQTKSQSVGKTVRTILAEMEKITKEEVSPEELQLAKDSIVNSFIFRYNSPHAIATQQMSLEFLGFPRDYLETYTGKIAQVSAKDVLAAARKYLKPSEMTLAIVGNQKDFDVQISTFGNVVPVDLSIRE